MGGWTTEVCNERVAMRCLTYEYDLSTDTKLCFLVTLVGSQGCEQLAQTCCGPRPGVEPGTSWLQIRVQRPSHCVTTPPCANARSFNQYICTENIDFEPDYRLKSVDLDNDLVDSTNLW